MCKSVAGQKHVWVDSRSQSSWRPGGIDSSLSALETPPLTPLSPADPSEPG